MFLLLKSFKNNTTNSFRFCIFLLSFSINTSAAVSAANLLLKSVEAVLPKQKKNLAIVEFKQAKVALKRRSKNREEEDIGMFF